MGQGYRQKYWPQGETKRPLNTARWIARANEVIIQGISIEGGWFYIGRDMRASVRQVNDPSLIDPQLPIVLAPFDAVQVHELPRPNYTLLPPPERRAYLEWLAGARSVRAEVAKFRWIYFYGLERRLILERAEAEGCELVAEVIRLKEESCSARFEAAANKLLAACHRLRRLPAAAPRTREIRYVSASGSFSVGDGIR